MYDLSHIRFEGKMSIRPPCTAVREPHGTVHEDPATRVRRGEFIAWVLGCAGLDAAAYRPQPLERRLPACLRALRVNSLHSARELLERKPHLLAKVVNSLLIGVTEFFREPGLFHFLSAQVLPSLAGGADTMSGTMPGTMHPRSWSWSACGSRPRIWSAACSTGGELYSMAILLSAAGLLERSYLLGSDCRSDAIERAKLGLYDATLLKLVQGATRDKYFERHGESWRPAEALRRQVHWKVADLLAGVEEGPWDVISWQNMAIYLNPRAAELIWRRLVSVLAPSGVLMVGKADRPPSDAGLKAVARCIYRRSA